MAIETFDVIAARNVVADIEQALDAVAQKHGISIKIGNTRLDMNGFKTSVEGKAMSDAVTTAVAVQAARAHGLDPEKVGPRGEMLIDYNSRAHKMPWIIARNGKRYKTTTAHARSLFGM